jgi:ribonuclease HII
MDTPTLEIELALRAQGRNFVAGLDEAGRGAWAGPVVAAAVVLPLDRADLEQALDGVRDSKQLSPSARNVLFEVIHPQPAHLILDHLRLTSISLPQVAFPKADAHSYSVAAASIVAKVTRDRLMCLLDGRYPGYGFARHKGYGTAAHRAALAALGASPIHRMSFAPLSPFL